MSESKTPHPIYYRIVENKTRFLDLARETKNPLYLWASIHYGQFKDDGGQLYDLLLDYLGTCADQILTLAEQDIPAPEKRKKLSEALFIGTKEFEQFTEDHKSFSSMIKNQESIDKATKGNVSFLKEEENISRATAFRRIRRARLLLEAQDTESHEE